jgi:hypothetical protein
VTGRSASARGVEAMRQLPPAPGPRADQAPAGLSVSRTLCRDPVVAAGVKIANHPNSVALFANIFAGDCEEMLFIDVAGNLRWLRHTSSQPVGWEVVDLGVRAHEVVAVTHPTGLVFALLIVGPSTIRAYVLEDRLGSSSGPAWSEAKFDSPTFTRARRLSIQYVPQRPLNAYAFALDGGGGAPTMVTVVESEIPVAGASPRTDAYWRVRFRTLVDDGLGDRDQQVLCAMDGPPDDPDELLIWSLRRGGVLHESRIESTGGRGDADLATGVDSLAGLFSTPRGVGCVALAKGSPTLRPSIVVRSRAGGEGCAAESQALDRYLEQARVWQDDRGMLHIFGLADGGLHVVSQVSLVAAKPTRALLPVWESTTGRSPARVAIARPVIAGVSGFALDPRPAAHASEHVRHDAGTAGEGDQCAIYTQDVDVSSSPAFLVRRSSARESHPVSRYKTLLTLIDGCGRPLADQAVDLTSDQPIDVEVHGSYHRTSPGRPARLATDSRGTIKLQSLARGPTAMSVDLYVGGAAGNTIKVTIRGTPH